MQFGITSLWYASSYGRIDTIKELVEFGAEVDLPIEVKTLTLQSVDESNKISLVG